MTTDAPASRYKIQSDHYTMPCEHEMCWQLHQRFMTRTDMFYDHTAQAFVDGFHEITRQGWIIIDTVTNERAFDGEWYETRREAAAALALNLKRLSPAPSAADGPIEAAV